MARCSSRLLLAALLVSTTGCWTGMLASSARLHEFAVHYDGISVDGNDVVVDYTVEIARSLSDRKRRDLARKPRAAVFPLTALQDRSPIPVEAFPIRRVSRTERAGEALPMNVVRDEAQNVSRDILRTFPNSLRAEIVESTSSGEGEASKERHHGFRLCEGDDESGNATQNDSLPAQTSACYGFFYSAALYDDPLAWWFYPVAPLAFVADIALVPIQLITLPPLLALSD